MKLANIVAAVAVLGLVSWVFAADEPAPTKPKHSRLGGQIVKIDGLKITIKTPTRGETEGKEVVVTTDDKTVFTLDEKEAKLADLKVDFWIRVTPAEGTATKVTAFTKKPERRKPDAPKAN